MSWLLLFLLSIAFGGILSYVLLTQKTEPTSVNQVKSSKQTKSTKKKKPQSAGKKPVVTAKKSTPSTKKDTIISHDRLERTLKGHKDLIVSCCFVRRGSHVLTASNDRTVRLWNVMDTSSNNIPYAQANITRDCASIVCANGDVDADTVYGCALLADSDDVQVYEMGCQSKPSLNLLRQFCTDHRHEVIDIAMAMNQSYLVTCSGGEDTMLKFWDFRNGSCLHSMSTNRIQNFGVCLSSSSILVFVWAQFGNPSAWMIDHSSKSFARKAMELKGRKQRVRAVAVSRDQNALVCVHEDSVVKVWNIDVRYEVEEDPKPLHEFAIEATPRSASNVVLSHDAKVAIFAIAQDILFYRVSDGQLLERISGAHSNPISSLSLVSNGQKVLSCGDRIARVWSVPQA